MIVALTGTDDPLQLYKGKHRVRPKQKMFKSKRRGRKQPIREVLEKSREKHFTIEKVHSIKCDR